MHMHVPSSKKIIFLNDFRRAVETEKLLDEPLLYDSNSDVEVIPTVLELLTNSELVTVFTLNHNRQTAIRA
jgi:hypothetical protein